MNTSTIESYANQLMDDLMVGGGLRSSSIHLALVEFKTNCATEQDVKEKYISILERIGNVNSVASYERAKSKIEEALENIAEQRIETNSKKKLSDYADRHNKKIDAFEIEISHNGKMLDSKALINEQAKIRVPKIFQSEASYKGKKVGLELEVKKTFLGGVVV